jgi:hypothetical protein
LNLNRSYGVDYTIVIGGKEGDSFDGSGCASRGCNANGYCADDCIKNGYGGIRKIVNQHREVVAFGTCCDETTKVTWTSNCQGSGQGDCTNCYNPVQSNVLPGLNINQCIEWVGKGCPNDQSPGSTNQPPCDSKSNAIGVSPDGWCRVYTCNQNPGPNGASGWFCYFEKFGAVTVI